MDLKAKKLRIISRILQSNDPEILETIEELLSLTSNADPVIPERENTPPTDPDVRDLQASIDEIFQAFPATGKTDNPS